MTSASFHSIVTAGGIADPLESLLWGVPLCGERPPFLSLAGRVLFFASPLQLAARTVVVSISFRRFSCACVCGSVSSNCTKLIFSMSVMLMSPRFSFNSRFFRNHVACEPPSGCVTNASSCSLGVPVPTVVQNPRGKDELPVPGAGKLPLEYRLPVEFRLLRRAGSDVEPEARMDHEIEILPDFTEHLVVVEPPARRDRDHSCTRTAASAGSMCPPGGRRSVAGTPHGHPGDLEDQLLFLGQRVGTDQLHDLLELRFPLEQLRWPSSSARGSPRRRSPCTIRPAGRRTASTMSAS